MNTKGLYSFNSLYNILSDMHESDIKFVIWKNIHEEAKILNGDTDIDIFIPFCSINAFNMFCRNRPSVELFSPSNSFLSIRHIYFLGPKNKLYHFHIYHELYTGESHLKNFLVPFSRDILNRRIIHPNLFFIIDPEVENILILYRHYLKLSSLIGLFLYFKEWQDYQVQISRYNDKIPNYISFPFTTRSLPLYSRFLKSNIFVKYLLGKYLRYRVIKFSIYGPMKIFYVSIINMAKLIYFRLFSSNKKKLSKGFYVAITGCDGSGKSTIISSTCNIFSKYVRTKTFHFGRPPSTFLTFPFSFLLYIRRLFNRNSSHHLSGKGKINLLFCFRAVILAYEKYRLSSTIEKYLSKNYLVICDRYPSLNCGTMDSLRIPLGSNFIFNAFHWLESYLYNCIKPVNLLFEIQVSENTAVSRNNQRYKSDKESSSEIISRLENNKGRKFNCDKFIIYNNDGELIDAVDFIFKNIFKMISIR